MENKAIQIEPKAATEMQSWTNIYVCKLSYYNYERMSF